MSFQKMLVATDFDETSNHALDYALSLAGKLGAKVAIVHVYSLPVYNFPDGSYMPMDNLTETIRQGAQQQLDALLDTLVKERKAPGIALEGILREGRAADEINAAAAAWGADLIVIGTHGRGLIGRALLGSVAQRVVREANVPVLTVHSASSSSSSAT